MNRRNFILAGLSSLAACLLPSRLFARPKAFFRNDAMPTSYIPIGRVVAQDVAVSKTGVAVWATATGTGVPRFFIDRREVSRAEFEATFTFPTCMQPNEAD